MWFAGPARRRPVAGRPEALRLGFDLFVRPANLYSLTGIEGV